MIRAYELKTAYLRDPIGIDGQEPRLSWKVCDAVKQTAFTLAYTVNDGEEKTIRSAGDDMFCILKERFSSRDRVRWRVRLTDENGQEGSWTEASFEYGLLEEADWTAKWIMGDYVHDKKGSIRYPADLFRKEFRLNGEVQRARLYITACGMYETMLNGVRVGPEVLTPGATDFRKRVQYQTYDVTGLLASETQEILWMIELADGYYAGNAGVFEEKKPFGHEPKVIAQMEILYADGKRERIVTDETFDWCNDGPVTFSDMKLGETVDFNRIPSFSGKARVTTGQGKLCASDNVGIREHETFHPKSIRKMPDGSVLVDFGQNIAGYVSFTVSGPKGHRAKLVFSEKLDEEGKLTVKNVSSKEYDARRFQTEEIILNGETVTYKPRYTIMGFQYMLLLHWSEEVREENFTAIAVYSDMEVTYRFSSSDGELDRIVENTLWSVKGNFCDVPTDCPTRERAGWTGDAQLFFNTGNYMMDQRAFFRKWLRDVTDAQKADGMVYNVNPGAHNKGGLYEWFSVEGSSGWGDALITIPYYFWKRYGDESMICEFWPAMERCYAFYHRRMGKRNLLSAFQPERSRYDRYISASGRHFGEWTEPADCSPGIKALILPAVEEATAYLAYTSRLMGEMADALGEKSKAEEFRETGERVCEAYGHYFIRDGVIESERMCKYVRPLALGLVKDDRVRSGLLKKIVELNRKREYRIGTGFLSTPFFFPLLTEAGESDEGYKTLMNPEFGWLQQVRNGATTVWENWTDDASLNHYSKGACCQWLFDTVCGIRLDGRRNHFVIRPNVLNSLDRIAFSYESVYGRVESAWTRENESISYHIVIPANCEAELYLPGRERLELKAGEYVFS